MAKYKSGIIGPLSGKMGNAVAVNWRGVAYLREAPDKRGSNGTEKQLEQRFKFALVSGWLQPLRDVIWIGYGNFKGSKTPMNGCIGHHLVHALKQDDEGVWAIDFEKAVFSRGELLMSYVYEVQISAGRVLKIKWEGSGNSVFSAPDDKATFIVYSPDCRQFAIFDRVCDRGTSGTDLKLPAVFAGSCVQVWMHYVNITGDAVSTTLYLGKLEA